MAEVKACMKCGKRSVEPRAVLPGSSARVCLDCYKQEADCAPLPSPASPVPMPYPGTMQAHAGQFEPATKVGGKKAMTRGKSSIRKTQGDQAGTMKDISSFQTGQHAWPLPVPAVTVHFEGSPMSVLNAAKLREQQGGGE